MITLLSHVFIKDTKENERQIYGTICSFVGIFLNVCLFFAKYFAGTITGSIAITADAFNNLSDAGSSFITLAGFRLAEKKPDPEHPFGHGRFEYIAGFIVSIAIILMGFELAKTSVSKIIHPEVMDTSMAALIILLLSIAVKVYMAYYNSSVGKKIESQAMKATALDSLSDCIATSVVLVCMLIFKFFHINGDGLGGLFVAGFILFAGYNAVKETIGPLLGTTPTKELVDEIEKIVLNTDLVVGMHDLVIHDYGPGRFMISLHAEVPGNENIYKLHDQIDNLEQKLCEKLGCEATVHMDPVEIDNEIVKCEKAVVQKIVRDYNAELTIHDFRMVSGDTHTNVIFDVVVPMRESFSNETIKDDLQRLIKEYNPKYVAVIKLDKDYVHG